MFIRSQNWLLFTKLWLLENLKKTLNSNSKIRGEIVITVFNWEEGDHFRFQLSRGIKIRVQEIGRKTWWKAIHMKRFFTCAFTIMEIKNIFMWKSFHKDSFWNGGKRELGKGLCNSRKKEETGWEIKVCLFACGTLETEDNGTEICWENFSRKSSCQISKMHLAFN